ncbi:lantibiotic dehydratase [Streptomyces sp. A1-5]|uniref:lantibiotic dehydratase n=1 Tax=Streptomyces sp. A1-5 TaxID=2738410 RepID=UPI001F1FC5E1|nr:lantibiotic dehydratase [Streptomyces sp. A1-5]UJB45778.1 lantibiotic dehydratase [Streptomyces sp. A1-5]
MSGECLFRGVGVGMVRAPVLPMCRAAEVPADLGTDQEEATGRPGPPEPAELLDPATSLRMLAADPLVREAVLASHPALAAVVRQVLDGSPDVNPGRLRQAVRTLTSHRLRMSTRATPFGLMAGVAPVRYSTERDAADAAKVRWGGAHTRGVRPDLEWLAGLVAAWERRPGVLAHLRVVVNGLCTERGGRLVLPYVPQSAREGGPPGDAPDGAGGRRAFREVSVRNTLVVQAVRQLARRPLRGAELVGALLLRIPGATEQSVYGTLSELVAKEILLTEARPPSTAGDPLRHVLRICADVPPAHLPELAELRLIRAELTSYAARPVGSGTSALEQLGGRMRRLCDRPVPLHVELALDVEVRLPAAVVEEAARAAEFLWRLSPPESAPDHLREYREAFVTRYGTDRVVPVTEVLDPDVGLGAPAGYRCPAGSGRAQATAGDPERDRVLAGLAQQALLSGASEVVLDPDHPAVRRLARAGGRPPATLELHAQLLAASCEALSDGDFGLVVLGGTGQAGALLGRFGHLLDGRTVAELAALVREEPAAEGSWRAQVALRPGRARPGNATQVPQWLDRLLPVGGFADPDDPGVLELRGLAVRAEPDRLSLVDSATGRRVDPAVFHVLTPQWDLPDAARFVCELAESGVRRWRAWDWGGAGVLPYLPRVRYGRTVLAPARWRPAPELLDARLPFAHWRDVWRRWREGWRVPERVWVGQRDRGVQLDLSLPGHLALLRHELLRSGQAELREVAADAAGRPDGWLRGPGGAHHAEVVLPLRLARPAEHPEPQPPAPRRHVPPRPRPGVHLPGGEWLSTAWYAPAARHEELLAVHLPALVDQLPAEVDRWFFLRHRDAYGPHLALRFHAPPEVLAGKLLPRLHDTTGRLRDGGLLGRVVCDGYDPEWERYGGPEAIAAAERVFHADSVTVLEHLRRGHARQEAVEPPLLAAAGFADLARAFHADGAAAPAPDREAHAGADWLLRSVPRDDGAYRAFRERRRQVLSLVDPYRGDPGPAAGGHVLRTAWARRARQVSAYRHLLRELGDRSWSHPDQVLHALLQMHHNRLIGIDEESERLARAVARGAAQAHTDRRRQSR